MPPWNPRGGNYSVQDACCCTCILDLIELPSEEDNDVVRWTGVVKRVQRLHTDVVAKGDEMVYKYRVMGGIEATFEDIPNVRD